MLFHHFGGKTLPRFGGLIKARLQCLDPVPADRVGADIFRLLVGGQKLFGFQCLKERRQAGRVDMRLLHEGHGGLIGAGFLHAAVGEETPRRDIRKAG